MLPAFLIFSVSLFFLIYCSNWVVDSVLKIATRFNIPKMILSIFVLGLGTSLPELVTAIQAANVGAPDLILSNIIGSNFANIGIVLGISSLFLPLAINKESFKGDAIFLFLTTALLACLGFFTGTLSTLTGILFLGIFIAYMGYHFYLLQKHRAAYTPPIHVTKTSQIFFGKVLLILILGFVGMGVSAYYLVNAALEIAIFLEVPQFIIGFTLVAIGTSLPELATSLVAVFRRESDLVFGNIMGSNIYNLLVIIGITSLITPLNASIALPSIFALLAFTTIYLLFALWRHLITRVHGLIFIVIYGFSFWQFALNS